MSDVAAQEQEHARAKPARMWRISSEGFCDRFVMAASAGAAKWKDYSAGREVGYFSAGFADYLARLGGVTLVADGERPDV